MDRATKTPPKPRAYDEALIQRLCQRVYRARMDMPGDFDRLVAEKGADKVARWSLIYAPTVRATLDALNEESQCSS